VDNRNQYTAHHKDRVDELHQPAAFKLRNRKQKVHEVYDADVDETATAEIHQLQAEESQQATDVWSRRYNWHYIKAESCRLLNCIPKRLALLQLTNLQQFCRVLSSIVGRCGVVGSTLAFGSIGHGFESEHRLFSHHGEIKLRSLAKCSLDDSVRRLL